MLQFLFIAFLLLPIDLVFGQPERENNEQVYGSQYANELSDKIGEVHEFARSRLQVQVASDAMKRNCDIKSTSLNFKLGMQSGFMILLGK